MTELVLDQLRHLSSTLTVLRSRVREAVASEVAKAVAEGVTEVLTVTLGGRMPSFARYAGHSAAYGRPDWDDPDRPSWEEGHGNARRGDRDDDDESAGGSNRRTPSPEAALAIALAAGRWWLRRRGSSLSAAGVGLAAGATLLTGGPMVQAAIGVLLAVQRLLAATDAIGDGAKAMGRV